MTLAVADPTADLRFASPRQARAHLENALRHLSADPQHEAERWICRALGWSRAQLYARLDNGQPVVIGAAPWQRRVAGEPLAYIWEDTEFYGLSMRITPAALIPRPDTETLVDRALEILRPLHTPRVLDLGTGSGAIALAIASVRPDAQVTAIDRSTAALALAHDNARRLNLSVTCVPGDWLHGVPRAQPWDLIVANPPYIAADDPHLAHLQHEPADALVASDNGLADLRVITRTAPAHLRPDGHLLLEHGWNQAAAVRDLLTQAGLVAVQSWRDGGQQERVSEGRRPA